MSRILPQCPEPFGHDWRWLFHLKSTYHDNLTPQTRDSSVLEFSLVFLIGLLSIFQTELQVLHRQESTTVDRIGRLDYLFSPNVTSLLPNKLPVQQAFPQVRSLRHSGFR